VSYITPSDITIELIDNLPNLKWLDKDNIKSNSACPFCGEGDDRFVVWRENGKVNYWCNHCHINEFVNGKSEYDPALVQAMQSQRLADEKIKKQKVAERMKSLPGKAAYYHSKLGIEGREYWHGQGLTNETVARYELGHSSQGEAIRGYATCTIPIVVNGQIVNIKHRLKGKRSDKYRPQFAGLGNRVFNSDRLSRDDSFMPPNQVMLVEGELKAILLDQAGYRVIALPGAKPGHDCLTELVELLAAAGITEILIALDEGQELNSRENIAPLFPTKRVIVCDLPNKPDDLIVIDGWTPEKLYEFVLKGEDVTLPMVKIRLDRQEEIQAQTEVLETPVFSTMSEADIVDAHWIGFPIIETKEDYLKIIIPRRKIFSKAKDWQEEIETYFPELDSEVEYQRKLTENKITKKSNCGRVIFSKVVNGKVITRHAPCGECKRCEKMDRENLLEAIRELGETCTILTRGDQKEKNKVTRQCRKHKVLYKVFPVVTDSGFEYEIIIANDMPTLGKILEMSLLTDDHLDKWVAGAKGKKSSGQLLPSKRKLRKLHTERLPYEADDNVPDKDCEVIETFNIIPKDNRAKPLSPSIVDNVNSLAELKEALKEQHNLDMKKITNQGNVIYGVSSTLGRYTKSDIPLIIKDFNSHMDRLREAKQQKE